MRKKLLMSFCAFLFVLATGLAQTTTVTGKVTDDKGNPLPGASVLEKGTKNGVSADGNGSFSIKVKSGATLIVSEIGYENQQVAANATNLLIKLVTDTKALNEVVVTGVGVATSKKKLAIAVESVTADKLPAAPTVDIGSALVGKIAGAQISTTNGSPGSPTQILLRGINSINGSTSPMILLDGIQIASTGLESLDLNGIERVEVVQGPAASTLYGAQGANGVIQLFSKKGKMGKINIDISSSVISNELLNVGNVNKSKYHSFAVNAAGNVVDGAGVPLSFDGVTGSYLTNPVFNLISASSKANQLYDKNLLWYDHNKMFFKKANAFNNSINISGAKEKMDFAFILSDSRQETVFRNNGDYARTNLTANIGVELAKGLKFRSITQIVRTNDTQLDPTGRNMLFAINNSRPFANYEARDDKGFMTPYFGDAVGVNAYNFNYVVENAKVKDQTIDVLQNFNLNYRLNKFVELDAKYGINRSTYNSRYEIKDQTAVEGAEFWQYWAEFYSPRTSFASPTTGSESGEINERTFTSTFQNFTANASIKLDFEKDFKINIPLKSATLVGWDYRKRETSDFWTYGSNAPDFTPYRASNMAVFNIATDAITQFATYGILVNQHFDWGEIAGVSAGLRSDYSSAFGQGSKPFTFPRGDFYFRPTSLGFFQNAKIANVLNEWKIRAAYGEAGIQPGAYDRFPILGTATIGTQTGLSTPISNANPDLQVEVAKELEIGTDLGFKLGKGNWLSSGSLGFTYWERTSDNIIDRVDVAPSIGIGRQLTNSMTLKSNGIQASLNLNVYRNKDWNWDFTANFSKQKSWVDKVLNNAQLIKTSNAGSSQYIVRAGEKIGQIYGYIFPKSLDEVDPDGVPYFTAAEKANYVVASNGYVVNKTTRQPFASAKRFALGDPNPKFNMSFINSVNYKGIVNFGMQWDWVSGSSLYNQTKQWMYRDGIHADYGVPVNIDGQTEAWTAFYRGAYAVRQANGTKSYFMEDASFWRLRNISVGVDFAKVFKLKGFTKLQLLFSGRNLITITKYTGYDPEVSSGANNSAWDRAVDHNTVPNIKSYQLGLNVGF
ncbi:MAG: SusC/RagA family TonB-linked outer membrane protein [Sediminibacterium sp.]|nr:SusC/RagA family TonB-linked outer membrane protein [Sediminibacterium sp.]